MSFVEPTTEECRTLDDLRKIFNWAGIPGNLRHPGTIAGSLLKVLEIELPADDHVPVAEGPRTPTLAELQWRLVVQFANIDTDEFKDTTNNEWYYCKAVPPDMADDTEWSAENSYLADAQPAITKRAAAGCPTRSKDHLRY